MTHPPQTPPKPMPPTPTHPPPFAVSFDWREFLPHLAEADLTDAEKQAFIETMWSIVLAFVDLGFEVGADPESCGERLDLSAALRDAVVSSPVPQTKTGDAA